MTLESLADPCHAEAVLASVAIQYQTGKFSDVKIVCFDAELWAHRLILGSVSPFLKEMLLDLEGQDVVTLFLPHIKAFHMRLVLDYIYQGSMFLRASHMQFVVRVIEVLQMKCGVSVSKMVPKTGESDQEQWEEQNVAKFQDLELYYQPIMKLVGGEYSCDDNIAEEPPIEVKPLSDDDSPVRHLQRRLPIEYDVVDIDEDESDFDEEPGAKTEENPHSCVMCGKAFQHATNLKIHLQSHLGLSIQLKSCSKCKRNFRGSLEHELHMNSHGYSRLCPAITAKLAAKLPRSEVVRRALVKRSVKKLVAVALKNRPVQPRKPKKEQKKEKPVPHDAAGTKLKIRLKPSSAFSCTICGRTFTTKGSLNRHAKAKHEASLLHPQLKMKLLVPKLKLNPVRVSEYMKQNRPKASSSPTKIRVPEYIKQQQHQSPPPPAKKRKLSVSRKSPSLPSSKRGRITEESPPIRPHKQTEDDLTCPTCDKVFMARSIFERHLRTYRHGAYQTAAIPDLHVTQPVGLPTDLPHLNPVIQPKMEVGGKQVNKYECHLCNQVFLRVKDLAKHRTKTCTAWFN